MIVYAASYEGFPITKIGTTAHNVKQRLSTMGFVVSDKLEIATIEVDDGFAVERVAHAIAERRGGRDMNAVAHSVFQNPETLEGIVMRSGNTEVYNVTFKQACRIIKEAAKIESLEADNCGPLIDLASTSYVDRRGSFTWATLPVKSL